MACSRCVGYPLGEARNQRHALEQWPVVVGSVLVQLDGVIDDLEVRLVSLEKEIAEVLADGAWASSAALLSTIPGIGLVTSAGLLVSTLNFSLCATPEQAAAYAGLVPLQKESGTSVRGRAQLGHGGNGRLRTALCLASFAQGAPGDALQPSNQGILQAIASGRQAIESGTLCGSAEVVACGVGGGDEGAAV